MARVCIVGAGAIGGFLGARLAAAGQCEVAALARGATLDALRRHGWRLVDGENVIRGPARASDDPRSLGVQDVVIVALKAPALRAVAPSLAPLIGAQTVVVPAMNGVPWWFPHGIGALGGAPLASVDPGGKIAAAIPYPRVIGCVVHAAASAPEPGLARHGMGRRLVLGEPDGGASARLAALAALLADAGFDVETTDRIRHEVWYKLWGNLTMNPVSALTGATVDRVLDDTLVRGFCSAAMREAAEIGRRIGCDVAQDPEDRHAVTRKLGRFKSSMQQDAEAGRPIELDAIVGAVREIGLRVGVPMPNIDALLGLARLFARQRGLYPDEMGEADGGGDGKLR